MLRTGAETDSVEFKERKQRKGSEVVDEGLGVGSGFVSSSGRSLRSEMTALFQRVETSVYLGERRSDLLKTARSGTNRRLQRSRATVLHSCGSAFPSNSSQKLKREFDCRPRTPAFSSSEFFPQAATTQEDGLRPFLTNPKSESGIAHSSSSLG